MFSGNEWVILVLLVVVMAVPAVIIAAIVLGMRRRGNPGAPNAQVSTPTTMQQGPPPGWFPDPAGRSEQRHWDGAAWTDAVVSNGEPGTDPL